MNLHVKHPRRLGAHLTGVALVVGGLTMGAGALPAHALSPQLSTHAAHAACLHHRATIVGHGQRVIRGTAGRDVILGTSAKETIKGLGGNDIICASGGNDTVEAGAGSDTVDGGPGSDELHGDGGSDALFTGSGKLDVAYGEDGSDTITLQSDDATGYGGDSTDFITSTANKTLMDGGAFADKLTGGPFDDIIVGDDGDDDIDGGLGANQIQGGAGEDLIDSGAGASDTVYGGPDADDITLSGPSGYARGDDGNDAIVALHGAKIDGGAGNDAITGSSEADNLIGGPGDDSMAGGDGADFLEGDDGADTITGDGGDDTIEAGDGVDHCSGGSGEDRCGGGTPGGADNTPADPDVCDETVEHMTSCRSTELPSGWTLTATTDGSQSGASETYHGGWTATVHLTRLDQEDSRMVYTADAASLTWHVNGVDYGCTVAGQGTQGLGDVFGRLDVDPTGKTAYLDLDTSSTITASRDCPDGYHDDDTPAVIPHGFELDNLPFDPVSPVLQGSTTVDEPSGYHTTVTWRVEPAS